MSEGFEAVVADLLAREVPAPTPRRARLTWLDAKAPALIGMRRSGKTWALFAEMRRLLDSGVARDRMLYVDFEDERLAGTEASDLQGLLDAWGRRQPQVADDGGWLFLDEIHNVPGWERFVRRVLDERRLRVAITGSSARMLSKEIATSLRGRALSTEVLPFGFDEFLSMRGAEIPTVWPASPRANAHLAAALDRYLQVGGFPEVSSLDDDLRVRILQDYVDVVILRDVAERHQVTALAPLRALVRRLVSTPAQRFTVHRFYNDLKSRGMRIGKDTLYALVDHLEDAFLVFPVSIASESLRVRETNPRKVYVVDPGLAAAFTYRPEVGPLLENVVYLELRRRGFEVAYVTTPGGFEVDFLATRRGEAWLVQVCADLDGPAREREGRALSEARAMHPEAMPVVVTLRDERPLDDVPTVPAWRWLLEDLAS